MYHIFCPRSLRTNVNSLDSLVNIIPAGVLAVFNASTSDIDPYMVIMNHI